MNPEFFEPIDARRYVHVKTGVAFTLVDAGRLTMGMNQQEEQQLRDHPEDIESEIVECFLADHLNSARPNEFIKLSSFLIAGLRRMAGDLALLSIP